MKKESRTKKPGQKYYSREQIAWNETQQAIVDELIDILQSPEVIAFPDFNEPFYINCDASNHGLGAVLYQKKEGKDRVISYDLRTLSESEKKYHFHSGKLEYHTLKWAVTNRFSDYLRWGLSFTVYTDNNPAIGMRWVNELYDFNFTIKYRCGKENVDTDSFSRNPMEIEDLGRTYTETVDPRSIIVSIPPFKKGGFQNGS